MKDFRVKPEATETRPDLVLCAELWHPAAGGTAGPGIGTSKTSLHAVGGNPFLLTANSTTTQLCPSFVHLLLLSFSLASATQTTFWLSGGIKQRQQAEDYVLPPEPPSPPPTTPKCLGLPLDVKTPCLHKGEAWEEEERRLGRLKKGEKKRQEQSCRKERESSYRLAMLPGLGGTA